jgi:shikimate kinase
MSIRLTVTKPIVLIGMMGVGKTSVGRHLAQKLALPFVDADSEIEAAAQATITEIFERDGEAVFRSGERRVIARLLDGPLCVLATGGGAFMAPETRDKIRERAVSVWLRADVDLLTRRVGRRRDRPLLNDGNPRETLARLLAQRSPIYAEADIVVDSGEQSPDQVADQVIAALQPFFSKESPRDGGTPPVLSNQDSRP